MQVDLQSGDVLAAADAVILPVFTATGADPAPDLTGPAAAAADASLGGELSRLAADARFTGARGRTFAVATLGTLPARRIILAGLGREDELSVEAIRQAWGAATVAARDAGAAQIRSALPPTGAGLDAATALSAAVEGARLATYRFTTYAGVGRTGPEPAEVASLAFAGEGAELDAMAAAIGAGDAVAAAVAMARDLVSEPASVLNPAEMAARAEAVAAASGLEIRVLGLAELEALGAGAILAVGKGSANEPRLIHLTYRPEGGGTGDRQVGLVGKCITFDTGGYSIKTYDGMLQMKTDMAGGAAVLGAMSALRALGCTETVHGVICAAENMISGTAFRPGDILTAMNGVTIEVLSTDAEGRLVLADGLVYTARQGATELIDLATLTGAAVVALGDSTTALFASDDDLANAILDASEFAGEHTWRMPLTDALKEKIRGDVGDIKNTGGRAGGAITAALFLERFREGLPWAHLDIAGSARAERATAYTPKGASGTGVRTLLAYLDRR